MKSWHARNGLISQTWCFKPWLFQWWPKCLSQRMNGIIGGTDHNLSTIAPVVALRQSSGQSLMNSVYSLIKKWWPLSPLSSTLNCQSNQSGEFQSKVANFKDTLAPNTDLYEIIEIGLDFSFFEGTKHRNVLVKVLYLIFDNLHVLAGSSIDPFHQNNTNKIFL